MIKHIFLLVLLPLAFAQKQLVGQIVGNTCVFKNQNVGKDEAVQIFAEGNNQAVTHIRFEGSLIYAVPPELFLAFPNLVELRMQAQNVFEIRPNTFINARKLEILVLTDNKIQKIEKNAFKGVERLIGIWMEVNQVSEIHKDVFKNLTNLQHLTFTRNRISYLHPETLAGNPKLIAFSMDSNELTTLHKNFFINNKQLVNLWLSNNKFNALSNLMFSHLRNLQHLGIASNNCVNKAFGNNVFSQMKAVEAELRICTVPYLTLDHEELKEEIRDLHKKIDDTSAVSYYMLSKLKKLFIFHKIFPIKKKKLLMFHLKFLLIFKILLLIILGLQQIPSLSKLPGTTDQFLSRNFRAHS